MFDQPGCQRKGHCIVVSIIDTSWAGHWKGEIAEMEFSKKENNKKRHLHYLYWLSCSVRVQMEGTVPEKTEKTFQSH